MVRDAKGSTDLWHRRVASTVLDFGIALFNVVRCLREVEDPYWLALSLCERAHLHLDQSNQANARALAEQAFALGIELKVTPGSELGTALGELRRRIG